MAKRADAQNMEGKRRRGRLRMRWEDCVKRDLGKVGDVGEQQQNIVKVGDC